MTCKSCQNVVKRLAEVAIEMSDTFKIGSPSVGLLHLSGPFVLRGCNRGLATSGHGFDRPADHRRGQGKRLLYWQADAGNLFYWSHAAFDHGSTRHLPSGGTRNCGDAGRCVLMGIGTWRENQISPKVRKKSH